MAKFELVSILERLVGSEVTLHTIDYTNDIDTTDKGILSKNPATDDFILCGENISANIDDTLCCKVFYKESKKDNHPIIQVNIFD